MCVCRNGAAMPFAPGKSGNPHKQWKAGQSGNPAGKVRTPLKQALEAAVSNDDIAQRVKQIVTSDDPQAALAAIRYISDRTEGKVPETKNVNVTGRVKVELKWGDDADA